MSQQELQRVEVIALRRGGQITQVTAARRLGPTVRQVRRLEAKVAAHGAKVLRSRRRGTPSSWRTRIASSSSPDRRDKPRVVILVMRTSRPRSRLPALGSIAHKSS